MFIWFDSLNINDLRFLLTRSQRREYFCPLDDPYFCTRKSLWLRVSSENLTVVWRCIAACSRVSVEIRWNESHMALRTCWRFTGLAPRLLWNSTVLPGASVPGGRRSVSSLNNSHTGCEIEFYIYRYIHLLAHQLPPRVSARWLVAHCHVLKLFILSHFCSLFCLQPQSCWSAGSVQRHQAQMWVTTSWRSSWPAGSLLS